MHVGLGEKHREVLLLRNVHNFSYEEIAQELQISVGTVRSRIARAREKLRELMGADFMNDREFKELVDLYLDKEIEGESINRLMESLQIPAVAAV